MNAFAGLNSAGQYASSIGQSFSIERVRSEVGNLQARFANIRPVQDFFDFRRVSRPHGWLDAQSRINFNLGHFSTNYAIVFALLSIYALIKNTTLFFFILFVFGSLTGISYLNGEDLRLPGITLTTSQLYTGVLVIALPIGIWFSSFLGTVFWLIGMSGFLILGHATLMEKPIEEAFGENQV